jgi:hypothetical protein
VYQTRGYPIDHCLRRAYRAQRGPHRFPLLRARLERLRNAVSHQARTQTLS